MSLYKVQETIPFGYALCTTTQLADGADGAPYSSIFYNPSYCTLPRIYNEQWLSGNMWYDVNLDRYIFNMTTTQAAWPSWGLHILHTDAATGLQVSRDEVSGGSLFDNLLTNGELGKVYGNFGSSIYEMSSGGVTPVGSPILTKADVGNTNIGRFILNRQDRLIVIDTTMLLEVWNYGTNTRVGVIMKPSFSTTDMAYESNELGWAVMSGNDGLKTLMKFNYKTLTVESLTALQEGEGDTVPGGDIRIAYDERRKNLAVFQERPNAVDGAAAHTLTLYKPFSEPSNITEPVPVESLIPGKTTTFSAHMYGDRGEVGQINPVDITNSGDGTILQTRVSPSTNGAIRFQYLAGANPGADTITLTADL